MTDATKPVEMPWPDMHAGARLATSAYSRDKVASYGNARAAERDAYWQGEIDNLKRVNGAELVEFIGIDPVEIAAGAHHPMIPDSWRFGFVQPEGSLLRFQRMDSGPLVAWEAVARFIPAEPPSRPTAAVSGMELPPFESEWQKKTDVGFRYGDEPLANVRFGYEMARAALSTASTAPAESKCNPTLTECPRCKNEIQKCDGMFGTAPASAIKLPLLPNGAPVIMRGDEAFVRVSDLRAAATPDVAKMVGDLYEALGYYSVQISTTGELALTESVVSAIDALGAAATQAKASVSAEWVSVSDRLPDTARRVLACNPLGYVGAATYHAGHWNGIGGAHAWMELPAIAPQPPKD